MVTALLYLLNTVFALFGIDLPFLSNIGGMSLLTWLFIWIATYVFRFCVYHRMFLYYILVTDLLNIADYYIGIPLQTTQLIMLQLSVSCVFLFIILYLYVKCRKESASEAD